MNNGEASKEASKKVVEAYRKLQLMMEELKS